MKSSTTCILAVATLVLSGACTDIESLETGAGETVARAPLTLDNVEPVADASMYSGIWVFSTTECTCPAAGDTDYTPECAALDCRQSEVLGLRECGLAARAAVRYTASGKHLSAIGFDADLGGWTLEGQELTLTLESGESTFDTECTDDALVLGDATLTQAQDLLWDSIQWAWTSDKWIEAPYNAR
jgi:hypothetical protein